MSPFKTHSWKLKNNIKLDIFYCYFKSSPLLIASLSVLPSSLSFISSVMTPISKGAVQSEISNHFLHFSIPNSNQFLMSHYHKQQCWPFHPFVLLKSFHKICSPNHLHFEILVHKFQKILGTKICEIVFGGNSNLKYLQFQYNPVYNQHLAFLDQALLDLLEPCLIPGWMIQDLNKPDIEHNRIQLLDEYKHCSWNGSWKMKNEILQICEKDVILL